MEPIGFHADHFHPLAWRAISSARLWLSASAQPGVTRDEYVGEQGDDLSIECVSLGEPSGGAGKIAV